MVVSRRRQPPNLDLIEVRGWLLLPRASLSARISVLASSWRRLRLSACACHDGLSRTSACAAESTSVVLKFWQRRRKGSVSVWRVLRSVVACFRRPRKCLWEWWEGRVRARALEHTSACGCRRRAHACTRGRPRQISRVVRKVLGRGLRCQGMKKSQPSWI